MRYLLFLMILGFYACGHSDQATEIKKAVESGAFIVDVREPHEFATGSYPNAVNIPIGSLASRIKEFDNKSGVVVFCRSGKRAGDAKNILESAGIDNVINGINTNTIRKSLEN